MVKVRYVLNSDRSGRQCELTLSAISELMHRGK
jgi:hypothetical protein